MTTTENNDAITPWTLEEIKEYLDTLVVSKYTTRREAKIIDEIKAKVNKEIELKKTSIL
jgi:hypothetical protein